MTILAPYPVTEKVDALTRKPLRALFGALVYFYFVYIYFYLLFFLCNQSIHDTDRGLVSKLFPSSIDFGNVSCPECILHDNRARINAVLIMLAIWACHHSLFARGPIKKFLIETLRIPADLERSLYVLTATAMVHFIFHFWQPIELLVWGGQVTTNWMYCGILIGWLMTFVSTFMIDHFDLFGLRQATHMYKSSSTFTENLLYKWIRHPLMTGFFIQFWARPCMTVGSLIWALATTTYILLANMVEERDLAIMLPEYANYKQRTGAYVPICPIRNPFISPFLKKNTKFE